MLKKSFKPVFFLLALSCLFFKVRAQTYHFDNYTVQDGLSQSNVVGIVQDKAGFYWLATESGLSRFDGKTFQNYSTEDGLADNNIKAILLDTKGNMWLGHSTGVLTIYDGKKFRTVAPEGFPADKSIELIYEDRDGKIWISVFGFGVVCFENPSAGMVKKENYKFYSSKEGLNEYVSSIIQDKNKNYWFATGIGIKTLKKGETTFDFFSDPELHGQLGVSLKEDSKGNIWIGTYSSSTAILACFDPVTKKTNAYATSVWVNNIFESADGIIWALEWGGGILRVKDGKTDVITVDNGLSSNKISSLMQDREGNILLANYGTGISVYKGDKFIGYKVNNGLLDNKVSSVAIDGNNNVWVGSVNGVSVINKNGTIKTYTSINGNECRNVYAIVSDKSGDVWMSSDGRLYKHVTVSDKFVSFPVLENFIDGRQVITSLAIDKKNNVWIGTIDGLLYYNTSAGQPSSYRTVDGLLGNAIDAVYCDSKNRLWVACKSKGISMYDGKFFVSYTKFDGFNNTSPTAFADGNNENIWIGTKGGGVYRYDGRNFHTYRSNEGLPSDYINLVKVDAENKLWLGTNKGLVQFDYEKSNAIVYGRREGFSGVETSTNAVALDDDGSLWIGTVNGVMKYDAKKYKKNTIPPFLHVNSVKINNKDVGLQEHYELGYEENSFRVDFVGISLNNPEKVTYSILLDGYDKEWRPATKQSFEIFSNLPPNDYKLAIKACNAEGACVSEPIGFTFYIKPPFWKTWWFYLTCAVLIITIIVVYIKIRERQLIAEKKVLEEKVHERTAEVVQKNIELDEKNKDITASIRYAKRIQDAILLPDDLVKQYLPKTFVLFNPKDIVSGDFYWIYDKKDTVLFAAVDCTGHGVPGAFMSIVGHNLLDKIVGEDGVTQPGDILDALNKSVSDTLRQSQSEDQSIKDGMDIALCCFDRKTNELQFAGAHNPLWVIRNGELIEFKGNKFPIGNLKEGEQKKFTNNSITLQKGDTAYVFSDGYADQFGGPKGKKFMYSQFKSKLISIQHMDMEQQAVHLKTFISEWMGALEQVDDILVIGTRL